MLHLARYPCMACDATRDEAAAKEVGMDDHTNSDSGSR